MVGMICGDIPKVELNHSLACSGSILSFTHRVLSSYTSTSILGPRFFPSNIANISAIFTEVYLPLSSGRVNTLVLIGSSYSFSTFC
jgi:hypothetical protein